jgi:hypothetical protein
MSSAIKFFRELFFIQPLEQRKTERDLIELSKTIRDNIHNGFGLDEMISFYSSKGVPKDILKTIYSLKGVIAILENERYVFLKRLFFGLLRILFLTIFLSGIVFLLGNGGAK